MVETMASLMSRSSGRCYGKRLGRQSIRTWCGSQRRIPSGLIEHLEQTFVQQVRVSRVVFPHPLCFLSLRECYCASNAVLSISTRRASKFIADPAFHADLFFTRFQVHWHRTSMCFRTDLCTSAPHTPNDCCQSTGSWALQTLPGKQAFSRRARKRDSKAR